MTDIDASIWAIRVALDGYIFNAVNEADLQDQVSKILSLIDIQHDREVTGAAGRYDILVAGGIVLELKMRAPTAAVERQAQRYALMPDVSAVGVVTTSSRLAHGLMRPGDVGQPPSPTLGGKPFFVVTLRTT